VQPLSHAHVRALDFRPALGVTGAALALECGASDGCTGNGNVIGFGAGAKIDGWANYLGAYRPSGERPQTPGCWAVGCRRPNFPLRKLMNTPPLNMWMNETQPPQPPVGVTRCGEMERNRRCVRGEVEISTSMNVSSCQAFCETLSHQGRFCCHWFAKTKVCKARTGRFRFRRGGKKQYAAECTHSDSVNRRLQQFSNVLPTPVQQQNGQIATFMATETGPNLQVSTTNSMFFV